MIMLQPREYFYTKLKQSIKIPIKGVIFDMDGTLTIPVLDFKILRKRLGITDSIDILQYARNSPVEKKPQINQMIEDFEKEGLEKLKLQPHIHSVFRFLKKGNINTALVTRNNSTAVDAFVKKFVDDDHHNIFRKESDIFSEVLTRDFIPFKPDPAPAEHVCSAWQCKCENVLFVGDDKDDINCGRNAGTVTVLLNNNKNASVKDNTNFTIDHLGELIDLIQGHFQL